MKDFIKWAFRQECVLVVFVFFGIIVLAVFVTALLSITVHNPLLVIAWFLSGLLFLVMKYNRRK